MKEMRIKRDNSGFEEGYFLTLDQIYNLVVEVSLADTDGLLDKRKFIEKYLNKK